MKAGIKNIVVNAAAIEVAINDRVKTDRRDALKMARHLKAGLLTSIYIPSINTVTKVQYRRFAFLNGLFGLSLLSIGNSS